MPQIKVKDSQRKKKRDLLDSLGDDLLRYIVELVTNSDDSYRRMESSGINISNNEKVIYIELKQGKRESDTDVISVTDNAEGMSKSKLEEIFGTYGADNAGGIELHARGIFGQGASDVLRSASYEKKTAKIESFKDGKFSRLKYMMTEDLDSSIEVEELNLRNSQISDMRAKMRIPNNGTCISFGIPSSVKYKKNTKSKLKQMIETFPSFRYLLSQTDRKVVLIVDGVETTLSSEEYQFSKMELVEDKKFTYKFNETNLLCELKMYKNENKNIDNTEIIVVDENKTVFDNTMFDFGNMPSAKNMSGELIINNLYKICYENLNDENNPNAIIKDNRTGFDTRNAFYIGLNKMISPILDEILREHGTKSNNTDLTNNKKFNDALKKLNKYITNELKDSISGGNLGGQEAPIQGIKFVRSQASLTKGKTYDLKLLINHELIFESDNISIICPQNDYIEVSPNIITYDDSEVKDNNLVVKDVIIKALNITNEPVIIEARCREYKAVVLINVIEMEIHDPLDGFEFYHNELVLNPEGTHTASLYFDVDVVPIGSVITLTATDGLILNKQEIQVCTEQMLDDSIGCIAVKSTGGTIGNDYYIEANYDGLVTKVKITIADTSKNNNSGGGLISGIKLERNDLYFQAYYQPHTHEIMINISNPINKSIMGNMEDKNPDKPTFSKEQTKYLCDIIAAEAAKILVKTDNARKGELNFDDPQEAIEEVQNLIQQHKNKMFMDIYPAMVSISE